MKLSQALIRSFISTVAVVLIRAGCQYAQKQESVRKFQKWKRLQNLRRKRGLPRRRREAERRVHPRRRSSHCDIV